MFAGNLSEGAPTKGICAQQLLNFIAEFIIIGNPSLAQSFLATFAFSQERRMEFEILSGDLKVIVQG